LRRSRSAWQTPTGRARSNTAGCRQDAAGYPEHSRLRRGYRPVPGLPARQRRTAAIARRTGESEFGHWDDTRIVLTSDPQDPPHVDFYNSSYCRCPSSGRHLVRIHLRPAGRDSGHSPGDKPGWLELEPARAPADCRPADQHGAVQRPLRQSQPGAFRRPMGNRLPGCGSTARLG